MQFVQNVLARLAERFDPATLEEQVARVAGNLIVAVLTFMVFYLGAKLVDLVLPWVLEKLGVDQTSRTFATTLIRVAILTVGAVAALAELGINTPALVTSMGVAGLTIGFAARDALSNLVSGFFIFWDRPFVLGDLIDFEGGHGKVDRITLRATRVVTPDGKMVSIPNSVVLNNTVTSYTSFPHLRLDVPVTIGTGEDLGRVRRILTDVAAADPDYLTEPPPRMIVTDLGDYNVTVELRVWLANERIHQQKRPKLREAIFEALRTEGVDMPYETLSINPVEIRTTDPRRE